MTTRLTRITAPAEPLLSDRDAREQCRVTDVGEDYLLAAYVEAVTEYLDAKSGVLGEALVSQTWRLSMDAAPGGSVVLPLGPVQSVVQIKYFNAAGVETLFPAINYRLADTVVELVPGAAWPTVEARQIALWIDFVAGYGAPSAVPATVRQLARFMVADLYQNRESGVDQSLRMSDAFKWMFAAARSDRGLF